MPLRLSPQLLPGISCEPPRNGSGREDNPGVGWGEGCREPRPRNQGLASSMGFTLPVGATSIL